MNHKSVAAIVAGVRPDRLLIGGKVCGESINRYSLDRKTRGQQAQAKCSHKKPGDDFLKIF